MQDDVRREQNVVCLKKTGRKILYVYRKSLVLGEGL